MNISLSNREIMDIYNKINNCTNKVSFSSKPSFKQNSCEVTDINDISDTAKLEYEYSNKIKKSSQPESNINDKNTFLPQDAIDPSFIENYALEYAKIRKGISEECTGDEAERKISLLDLAYSDVINEAAQSLANDFQRFFGYDSSEWIYDNQDNNEKFDVESFKNNIFYLADKSFSIVKEAFQDGNFDNLQEKIEEDLSSVKSGTSVESMNYNDIKEIDSFLKSIPDFKNHAREYLDDGTYKPVSGNWTLQDAANAINKEHDMAEDLVKSGKVSSSTSAYVYETVRKNIDAYHKSFAFSFQLDVDQKEIDKDNSYYKLLKAECEKYEKKLEDARRKNEMKMVLAYLKLLSELEENLNKEAAKINEDTETKGKLSKDPNSVVDTDAYKAISNSENFNEKDASPVGNSKRN